MTDSLRLSRRRREFHRWRRLLVEHLEGRALLAATITVNSTADVDARDAFLTLREAIEVSNRTLDVASLTAQEQSLISGTPTAGDTDMIGFNVPATDPGHVYYANDGFAGSVSRDKVTPTAAASDAALINADPDWSHSWWSIQPLTELPQIQDGVVIDGYTQPGAKANSNSTGLGLNTVIPVELSGVNLSGDVYGLRLSSANSTVSGLAAR